MRRTADRDRVDRWAWIVALAGIGLLAPRIALAPPPAGGPKPSKKAPAGVKRAAGPKATRPRPAKAQRPPGSAKPLLHKPNRYVRNARYYHPQYKVKPAPTTWRRIGYPYYVGGTSYVIAPDADDTDSRSEPQADASPATPPPVVASVETESFDETDDNAAETYAQIQELVEIVHEWRTLNESPTLHERLPSEADAEHEAAISAIRRANERFDAATRQAMIQLAQGTSAEAELHAAQAGLEKLIELTEKLPAPASP